MTGSTHPDTEESDVRLTVTFDDGFDESGDFHDINFVRSRGNTKGWKQYDKNGYVEGVPQVPYSVAVKKEELREGMRGFARYKADKLFYPCVIKKIKKGLRAIKRRRSSTTSSKHSQKDGKETEKGAPRKRESQHEIIDVLIELEAKFEFVEKHQVEPSKSSPRRFSAEIFSDKRDIILM